MWRNRCHVSPTQKEDLPTRRVDHAVRATARQLMFGSWNILIFGARISRSRFRINCGRWRRSMFLVSCVSICHMCKVLCHLNTIWFKIYTNNHGFKRLRLKVKVSFMYWQSSTCCGDCLCRSLIFDIFVFNVWQALVFLRCF